MTGTDRIVLVQNRQLDVPNLISIICAAQFSADLQSCRLCCTFAITRRNVFSGQTMTGCYPARSLGPVLLEITEYIRI